MFRVHFTFAKPDADQDKEGITKYYEWADMKYSKFMILLC